MPVVYPLSVVHRRETLEHLLRLPADDRRLRFGGPTSDEVVARYVEGIDFDRDAVFGIRADDGQLIGATHVARFDDTVELGLSVDPTHRNRGLAQTMFHRAHLYARNRGFGELYMHCLSENATMMHIARKAGMRIVIDGPERDAYLALPPATPLSVGEELREGQLVLLDWTLRNVVKQARQGFLAVTPGSAASLATTHRGSPARSRPGKRAPRDLTARHSPAARR